MGKEVVLFKSEERKSRSDLSEFLHQLADKISKDEVILRQDNQEITLQIPQNLVIEIKVEDENKGDKGIQHSLEVEIKWFNGEQGGSLELG